MKKLLFLISIAVCLLAGCGTASAEPTSTAAPATPTTTPLAEATPAQPESPLAEPTESMPPQPESPLAGPTATPAAGPAGSSDNAPAGALSWNPDPAAQALVATFCCGRVTQVMWLNAIADARLWGDGRIIWAELNDDNGQRRVLEGRLTPEQMQALFQRLSEAGFFGWEERYDDRSVTDAADQCLAVELSGQSKKVCEYVSGAPAAFHELYAYVAAGAGASGQEYTPTTGYLTAHPLQLPADMEPPIDFEWPAAELGLSLDQAVAGVWVEGETLETSWQMVNTKWQGNIIRDGEVYYGISLQIPGLSLSEPPAR